MFDWMFRGGGDFGRGAAIAIVIMLAVMPIMIWNIRQANREERGRALTMASAQRQSRFLGRFGVHIAVLFFVALWTIPTLGLLISSLRDKDQLAVSGWWTALATSTRTQAGRTDAADDAGREGRQVRHHAAISSAPATARTLTAFGTNARQPPTQFAGRRDRRSRRRRDACTVKDDGSFVLVVAQGLRRQTAASASIFAASHRRRASPLDNYRDGAVLAKASAAPSSTR